MQVEKKPKNKAMRSIGDFLDSMKDLAQQFSSVDTKTFDSTKNVGISYTTSEYSWHGCRSSTPNRCQTGGIGATPSIETTGIDVTHFTTRDRNRDDGIRSHEKLRTGCRCPLQSHADSLHSAGRSGHDKARIILNAMKEMVFLTLARLMLKLIADLVEREHDPEEPTRGGMSALQCASHEKTDNKGFDMNKNAIALGLTTLLLSGTAIAAPVFSDDFNRRDANNVGAGWSEIERNGNDVVISNNALQLRDVHQQSNDSASSPDAAATFSVSTAGQENLFLSFAWAPLTASEADDTLNLSWRVAGGGWMDLWSTGLGGNGAWSTANVGLGAAAADQQSIDIRFWTDVRVSWWFIVSDSPANEGARIDWVTLTGDAIPVAVAPLAPEPTPTTPPEASQAVPEPASLALLGLGLAGLGALRRRQHKA